MEKNDAETNVSEEVDLRSPYTPVDESVPSNTERRPGAEWVYPSGGHSISIIGESVNSVLARNDENCSQINYRVDPTTITVVETIDGRIVKDEGFCSKNCKLFYRKRFLRYLMLCAMVMLIIISSLIYTKRKSSLKNENIVPTNKPDIFEQSSTPRDAPSYVPSHVPSYAPFDNVTARIVAVSGKAIMIENSPQQRALQWILQQVNANQTYDDTQLIQRYSSMVLFYGLSGEQWWNKNSFGTYQHECDWYGITCTTTSRIVTRMDLTANNLRGKIPKEIALFSSMRNIVFSGNSLTGTIPPEIGQLRYLAIFKLNRNLFTSSIPSEIGNCTGLKTLYLQHNKLTGPIPSFSSPKVLQTILLFDNKLSGTIPSVISNFLSLETLRLQENEFTGTIPSDIEPLNRIKNLDFSNNNLNGTMPSSIQNLHYMTNLQLSDNYLTGTIPPNLSKLSSLVELHINNNDINGTIPESIQYLESVEIIDLSSNQISGTIPSSIGKLNSLNDLRIHSNMMTGTLPDEICDLSLSSLTSDCAEVPSKLSCSCCSECF